MLLDIRDIHCHYGVFQAVRGVSIQVAPGTLVALLGANGSGKSTTMKAVSGLIRPTQGEIWFDGHNIQGRPVEEIVSLGIVQVPEGKRLFPSMSVLENLLMGAYSRNDKEGIASDLEKLMARYRLLREKAGIRASALSGGQQAQLAIIRGLMAKPRMLLLDEPLQGLSPTAVGEVEDIILELRADGLTVLMVEHNVHLALSMSDKVYILDRGQVILEGHPKQLSETEYVQEIYLAR